MKKVYKIENVFDAARRRMAFIFDEFENKVQVSISGGKDSSVIAHLALCEAEKRGVKIDIFFLDQEAEYRGSIEVVRWIMAHPNANPLWYQVPFRMTNSVSFVEPFLNAWAEDEKGRWMRAKEPNSIQKIEGEYPSRFYDFFPYIEARIGRAACLVGLRSNESLNRYRSVIQNAGYKNIKWSTKGHGEAVKFYPIYDWGFDDVWKYIFDNSIKYNRIYDLQHMKGYYHDEMRVSYLMHEHSFRCLCDLPEFEPDTFERLRNRVSGIDSAMRYAKERTMYNADELPIHYSSWLDFREFLLEGHIDEKQKARFKNRFDGQMKNEAVYRQQVRQLLINDYEGNLALLQEDQEEKKAERRQKHISVL